MVLARFALASLLALSFPSNTPWEKPPDQWSAADTNKILEDSPWAPGKVTVETKYSQKYKDNVTQIVSDSPINSQNSPIVQNLQISKGGTPDYYVKWMSAKTMRLALEKMHRMRINVVGTQSPIKVEESPDYVIAIEGDEPMRIIRDAKEDSHDTVFVELDNGFTLDLASVHYIDGPDADPLRTEFHFPRLIEGKPAIDANSEKVVFHLRATAKREMQNRNNAIAIRVDFHPKEMRAQNVPDL
jgi:hypothetical protein